MSGTIADGPWRASNGSSSGSPEAHRPSPRLMKRCPHAEIRAWHHSHFGAMDVSQLFMRSCSGHCRPHTGRRPVDVLYRHVKESVMKQLIVVKPGVVRLAGSATTAHSTPS